MARRLASKNQTPYSDTCAPSPPSNAFLLTFLIYASYKLKNNARLRGATGYTCQSRRKRSLVALEFERECSRNSSSCVAIPFSDLEKCRMEARDTRRSVQELKFNQLQAHIRWPCISLALT